MATLQTLKVIRSFDPDGMETEPTPKDYDTFKSWVLTRFGQDTWDEYHTNWDTDRSWEI